MNIYAKLVAHVTALLIVSMLTGCAADNNSSVTYVSKQKPFGPDNSMVASSRREETGKSIKYQETGIHILVLHVDAKVVDVEKISKPQFLKPLISWFKNKNISVHFVDDFSGTGDNVLKLTLVHYEYRQPPPNKDADVIHFHYPYYAKTFSMDSVPPDNLINKFENTHCVNSNACKRILTIKADTDALKYPTVSGFVKSSKRKEQREGFCFLTPPSFLTEKEATEYFLNVKSVKLNEGLIGFLEKVGENTGSAQKPAANGEAYFKRTQELYIEKLSVCIAGLLGLSEPELIRLKPAKYYQAYLKSQDAELKKD